MKPSVIAGPQVSPEPRIDTSSASPSETQRTGLHQVKSKGLSRHSLSITQGTAGSASAKPALFRNTVVTSRRPTHSAATGFPGRPTTGTEPNTAARVGWPGLAEMRWKSVCPPACSTALGTKSYAPFDTPPVRRTISASPEASAIASARSPSVSTTWRRSTLSTQGKAPNMAARAGPLESRIRQGSSGTLVCFTVLNLVTGGNHHKA